MGYYLLSEGLRNVCVCGSMLSPSAEGILSRLVLKTLRTHIDNVNCCQLGHTNPSWIFPTDSLLRNAEECIQDTPVGDVFVFIGSDVMMHQVCQYGRANIAIFFPTKEEYSRGIANVTQSIPAQFSTPFWKQAYLELQENLPTSLYSMKVDLDNPYIAFFLDSETKALDPKVVLNAIQDTVKNGLKHIVVYVPGQDIRPYVQLIQKEITDETLQIDVLTDWLSAEERILLAHRATFLVEAFPLHGFAIQKELPISSPMPLGFSELLHDTILQDVENGKGKSIKRVGLVCDYTPAEICGEDADVMLFVKQSIQSSPVEKEFLDAVEWYNRNASIDCCINTMIIFQPKILTEERCQQIAKHEAKKLFIVLGLPGEDEGKYTRELMQQSAVVIFRSPWHRDQWTQAGLDLSKLKRVSVQPLFCPMISPLEKGEGEVGILEVNFDETIDLKQILAPKRTIVTNTTLPMNSSSKVYGWRVTPPEVAIAAAKTVIDLSRKPHPFNNALATAIYMGKEYKHNLFHGCLSYQELKSAMKNSNAVIHMLIRHG